MTQTAALLHLERLPRTVELVRAPDGSAELVYVDQRQLPGALVFERTRDWHQVVDAIQVLAVRGAPAIGVAGAAAVALWACNEGAASITDPDRFVAELALVGDEVSLARPTAVNLVWGVAQVAAVVRELAAIYTNTCVIADAVFDRVKALEADDEAANRAIGANGAALFSAGTRILTHCNAGSLATVFYGTALGVVYAAAEQGKVARVYADETRPVGQGARLTSWELAQAGVPVTLICDDMAASLMAQGSVDAVIVGADRIAANGDAANKIGTYGLAVLAQHHGIPLYVAAPTSTVDLSLANGSLIPIEQRDPHEVAANPPKGVDIWNPAFDVTPAELISRIITECGVFVPSELQAGLISVQP